METGQTSQEQNPVVNIIGAIFTGLILGAVINSGLDAVKDLLKPAKPKRRRPAPPLNFKEEELGDFEWIFRRTDGKCLYCWKSLCVNNRGYFAGKGRYELDHFIALSRGGADKPYNIVLACVDCNREKRDLLPWEFMPWRFRVGERNPDKYI
jgi:HNH endonuclease